MAESNKNNLDPDSRHAGAALGALTRLFRSNLMKYLLSLASPANLRTHFTHDKIIDALKTLAWVAPLTILIWIWAEREQLDKLVGQTVPIEVRLPGTNKVGNILIPRERNVVVTLTGPRKQLDAIRSALSQRALENRIILDLDPKLEPKADPYSLTTQTLLQRSEFFSPYGGVTISDVSPSQLTVVVSELETIEVPVRNPPAEQYSNLDAESVYDPPFVRVTARKQDLADRDALEVYPDLSGRDLSKPGTYDLKALPLIPSTELRDKNPTFQPSTVNAILQVHAANISYVMNSMPVYLSHPADTLDKFKVQYDPFLERVTLIGSREIIDAIREGRLQGGAPKAILELTASDAPPAAQPREKTVKFDLPEGVTVSPQDRSRKVSFSISPRNSD
ncbi:MAG: hypothetical protein IT448_09455 [Phycisphaerales bacterium]|nr:hypothetical protein [Phycisphaerales bacterium]